MKKNILILILIAIGTYFFFTQKDSSLESENYSYIGMTTSEANMEAKSDGAMFRVVEEDGRPQPTTRDFQEGRINAVVEGGIVTEFYIETNDPVIKKSIENEPINNEIIGMTTIEAETYSKNNDVDFRIVMIDGESLPITLDFRPGRINAEVENDIVVGYTVE